MSIKAQAIRIDSFGGPEVLQLREVEVGDPGPGEIRLRQTAIGLNYIDTYYRTGLYPLALPNGLGSEAAGIVEAVGEGVTTCAPGDRVAYSGGPPGAYASHRIVSALPVVKLPDGVSDEVAAAAMLKGGTVEFLVERCAKVEAGQTVLVQAAAGGVGLLLVQWLKHIGARVIATAGSPEKLALAKTYGADVLIDYSHEAVGARVRELTDGVGVATVFDGVGKATWEGSLDSLRKRGLMVSFGNASGPVGQIDFASLARKGSLFATRPTMFDYYVTREDIETGTSRLFELISSGVLDVRIDQRYPLADAAQAHRDLEARRTTGSTVLIP